VNYYFQSCKMEIITKENLGNRLDSILRLKYTPALHLVEHRNGNIKFEFND